MGVGVAVIRPTASSRKNPNGTERQRTAETQVSEGLIYFLFSSFFVTET
jgi:hypothetical protein